MNMGKKIVELREAETISGESSYPVSMGDGTGVKQVKHKKLVSQLLTDMEMSYDDTLAVLMETGENGDQKIPNLKAISDWIASKITNNLLATEEGFFLDARLGPVIDNRFKTVEDKVSEINSNLSTSISMWPIVADGIGNGTIKFVVGSSALVKNQKQEIPYIFADTEMAISGISIPIILGSRIRGCVQIYTNFQGNASVFSRKCLDGVYYGEW